ncbi:hypothetical protein ACFQT0_10980 [Hymenobacter humi]|uniref:Uncharacterized protein n=1 Tax=Hymenobacter humi TaxID=1411620 RepID=A0ABW2U312_9BACT
MKRLFRLTSLAAHGGGPRPAAHRYLVFRPAGWPQLCRWHAQAAQRRQNDHLRGLRHGHQAPRASLLFYTNGETVWNRKHQPMPNGRKLMGSGSSTQSALIVPDPGSGNVFYIFTVAPRARPMACATPL